jgi:salicylate hydroxylase
MQAQSSLLYGAQKTLFILFLFVHCTTELVLSGGGLGGLTLALVLKKYMVSPNITIDLYEAEPAFVEIGAGITLWQRTRLILNALGLADILEKRAVSPPLTFRKSDTKAPFSFYNLVVPRAPSSTYG